ncbi:uncharacterized protein LOC122639986 [Telopea speciosissima]|uniref:uncharacterized protein LOC122639986 n=1 Tax=Telopea speciosissima TaxID=54955 RepID=UPI001CC41381|nr:uncharacterized protein LOC122639986 [Telopea speciosissima]
MSNEVDPEHELDVEISEHDGNPSGHGILEAISSATTSARKRKKTSAVWLEFIQIPKEKSSDGRRRAKCRACGTVYLADSNINGTSTLRRHLKNCLKRERKSQMSIRYFFKAEPADDANGGADALRDVLTVKEREASDTSTPQNSPIASNAANA